MAVSTPGPDPAFFSVVSVGPSESTGNDDNTPTLLGREVSTLRSKQCSFQRQSQQNVGKIPSQSCSISWVLGGSIFSTPPPLRHPVGLNSCDSGTGREAQRAGNQVGQPLWSSTTNTNVRPWPRFTSPFPVCGRVCRALSQLTWCPSRNIRSPTPFISHPSVLGRQQLWA